MEGGSHGDPGSHRPQAGTPTGTFPECAATGMARNWTDARVTTEGIAYRVTESKQRRSGISVLALVLSGLLLITGAVCLWIAEKR
jgi:hypothetical protein